jgi:hypothetical protein
VFHTTQIQQFSHNTPHLHPQIIRVDITELQHSDTQLKSQTMAPSAQAHKRAHSLLLFEKLLNLRDTASPLTLILDTLEQSAQPLTNDFMRRAKVSL